jgi:chromate transporter
VADADSTARLTDRSERSSEPSREPARVPSFAEAARFWIKLGLISFGGPAGQIAIMHREVVERRRWVDEERFAGALNFCMLLPGPEAMQLAIYLGWKLHGMRGGLVAGLAFIGPAILLLLGLSWVYAAHGQVPAIAGVLTGLKAAVVALVLQALVKIGRRALRGPMHVALAIGAFAALQFLHVPFPLIVLGAGLVGLLTGAATGTAPVAAAGPTRAVQPARVLSVGLALWVVPLLACAAALGFDSLWSRLYLFFTQAALVTFGGAYAVLGYVTQHLVAELGWLTAEQAVSGLALAETTPGPLIIVLQFMGFMAGWNQPGPLAPETAAVLAALLASWATFLPSFVFIFLGAPYVERITAEPRVAAALAAITAAVVGIIGTLAVLFARVVLLPQGLAGGPDWTALAVAVGAWLLLTRTRLDLPWILAAAALAGLATH